MSDTSTHPGAPGEKSGDASPRAPSQEGAAATGRAVLKPSDAGPVTCCFCCGYRLSGLAMASSVACPECGALSDPRNPEDLSGQRKRWLLVVVLVLAPWTMMVAGYVVAFSGSGSVARGIGDALSFVGLLAVLPTQVAVLGKVLPRMSISTTGGNGFALWLAVMGSGCVWSIVLKSICEIVMLVISGP